MSNNLAHSLARSRVAQCNSAAVRLGPWVTAWCGALAFRWHLLTWVFSQQSMRGADTMAHPHATYIVELSTLGTEGSGGTAHAGVAAAAAAAAARSRRARRDGGRG